MKEAFAGCERCAFALLTLALCHEAVGADGFAGVNGDTTGGAGGAIVTVTTYDELQDATLDLTPRIVQVQGTITLPGFLNINSDKTIVGIGNRPTIVGDLQINDVTNVIVHNLFFVNDQGLSGGAGGDGISILNGSHHVWVDHCTFYDCDDGELDITKGSDYVTVSWCKFFYTRDRGHNFVSLVAASDTDTGNYRITYHHNWWSTMCVERMPRVRFGRIHSYNNYFNSPGNNYCIRAAIGSEVLAEDNYFANVNKPFDFFDSPPGKIKEQNNIFTNVTNLLPANDTVFTPPYTYTPDPAASVPLLIITGAGAHSTGWFTVDGGGGRSTNGSVAFHGTIGQPDAGVSSNAGFVVRGGYWALPIAVQTPGAPALIIVPAGPGLAGISWTPNTPGFVLQETESLSPANWTNSPSGPTNPAVVPVAAPTKFYRLFKP